MPLKKNGYLFLLFFATVSKFFFCESNVNGEFVHVHDVQPGCHVLFSRRYIQYKDESKAKFERFAQAYGKEKC